MESFSMRNSLIGGSWCDTSENASRDSSRGFDHRQPCGRRTIVEPLGASYKMSGVSPRSNGAFMLLFGPVRATRLAASSGPAGPTVFSHDHISLPGRAH